MYVLIIARGYPSEKYRMNGIFEFDQAKALHKAGMKVVYASVDTRSIRRWRKWGLEKKVLGGLPIYNLNIPLGRVSNQLRDPLRIGGLKRLYQQIEKEQGRPEIIHAHFISNGYIVGHVFKSSRIPLVLTEHYSGMNRHHLSQHFMSMGQQTYSQMDRVLAVSEALAENIREKFRVRAQVVPNVVDLRQFKHMPLNPDHTTGQPTGFRFVSVGGLTALKRMDLLIDSFHNAFSDNRQVFLSIFGAGPMRGALEKKIRNLGLEGQVFLKGLVSRREISLEFNRSDAFVLASESETFGLAFFEAMASGLPVIATRSGGPEEFVTEENGMLIEVDDPVELTQALSTMVEASGSYDRSSIARSIQEQFSEERLVKTLQGVYQELLNG